MQSISSENMMLLTRTISAPAWLLLAASGVLTLGLGGCTGAKIRAAAEPAPMPVETIRVQALDHYEVRRVFSGTVRSRRASQLGFERPGLVAKVFVDEGDIIQEGQLIAKLDTAQLRAARRRVSAGLKQAQAGVGISTLTADRLEKLAEEQYISRQSADEARFSLAAAEAKRMELRAALAQIDVDLDKSKLVAPFSGIVSTRLVDEGTVVGAGSPVVRFRESDEREAVIGVPRTIPIELGSTQELVLDGRSFEAPVTALVNDVNARTRTVTAILELPAEVEPADGQVIDLVHRRRVIDSGFWVPTTALTEGLRGMWTIYSVKPDGDAGIVQREAVEVLHAETDRVFVRGTLESSDQLISTGLHRVVPGQRVSVSTMRGETIAEPTR
jgi:RND family efflux transporter MFP subunit